MPAEMEMGHMGHGSLPVTHWPIMK